jgi:DNA-binding MarR family transcriptional regulator
VLGEAENATPNAVSLNAEGPSSAAASSILINPKSAKSDQNCLATAAATHDLPLDFFVRLIRQESNFDPNSVSHAGAQGIAQFMPGTARWRGLTDPFEPLQALYESARWLRELREQFGNLGLAAAAYNARPRRVQDWLAGRGGLPGETRAYEFDRRGRADINSVQALLLYNIGDKELTASELRTRGYYLGSNVSYNLKKLVELGFLDHQRSRVDRRSVRIRLTAQGQAIHRLLEALYQKHINTVEQVGGISNEEFATLNKSLHRLERFWTDQILYRL